MRREMKTVRHIVNQAGTISDRVRVKFKVHFDLVETQDLVDGVPDLVFSFGNLRFEEEMQPHISSLAVSRTPLILAGGGIQTTILLSGPNAFTVMSVVKEIRLNEADNAA
jgi:hypothetical protein